MKKLAIIMACVLSLGWMTGCGNGSSAAADTKAAAASSAAAESNTESRTGDGQENLKMVRIGTPATGDKGARMLEAARVAAEMKYFEEELAKEGYQPEYVGFDGAGPAVNEAMISGDLDVAIYGDMPALILASKYENVSYIAMDNSAVQQGIVVQKDSGITSVADLAGKKVIAETGTTCQKFLISLLETAGLGESDIEEISATTANAQAEFAAGEVDAVVLPCMAAYRLIDEKGVGEMLEVAGTNEALQSQYVVAANTEFLKENTGVGEAIVRALNHAQQYASENPDAIYELFADSNYSADVYRSVYSFDTSFSYFSPEITPDCVEKLKSLNAYALEKGLIRQSVDIDSVVTYAYLQAEEK